MKNSSMCSKIGFGVVATKDVADEITIIVVPTMTYYYLLTNIIQSERQEREIWF